MNIGEPEFVKASRGNHALFISNDKGFDIVSL